MTCYAWGLAGLLAVLGLAQPGSANAAKAKGGVKYIKEGTYVALGDSFSAGVGAPPYLKDTNKPNVKELQVDLGQEVNRCLRSPEGYPALVALKLYGKTALDEPGLYDIEPDPFSFRACSGATTSNIYPGPGQFEDLACEIAASQCARVLMTGGKTPNPPGTGLEPPQLTWLLDLPDETENLQGTTLEPNADIHLVTMTIGGNDAGFGELARKCTASNSKTVAKKTGYSLKACKDAIKAREGTLAAIATQLSGVYTEVHTAAPNALIRVLLYPTLLNDRAAGGPEENETGGKEEGIEIGNAPTSFGKIHFYFTKGIAAELAEFEENLNATISGAVKTWATAHEPFAQPAANIAVVDTRAALKGHQYGDEPNNWPKKGKDLWVGPAELGAVVVEKETSEGSNKWEVPLKKVENMTWEAETEESAVPEVGHPDAKAYKDMAKELEASLK